MDDPQERPGGGGPRETRLQHLAWHTALVDADDHLGRPGVRTPVARHGHHGAGAVGRGTVAGGPDDETLEGTGRAVLDHDEAGGAAEPDQHLGRHAPAREGVDRDVAARQFLDLPSDVREDPLGHLSRLDPVHQRARDAWQWVPRDMHQGDPGTFSSGDVHGEVQGRCLTTPTGHTDDDAS